jgi:tRNA threonylcarbamoyladenosine biosynthesis protein TsaB
MKNILAIDTSTKNVSVSIFSEDNIMYEKCWVSKNNHSIELIDSINKGFSKTHLSHHDLDCIAVAIGPGGFSSIRVGVSMSLGLAKANKIKTLGIPTFEIELENYRDSNYKDNLVSLVPAGFDAYCWKDIKNIENKNPDGIVNVNDIDKTFDKNTFFCGENLSTIFEKISSFKYADRSHREPKDILKLIKRLKSENDLKKYSDLTPIYSRSPNITKKK